MRKIMAIVLLVASVNVAKAEITVQYSINIVQLRLDSMLAAVNAFDQPYELIDCDKEVWRKKILASDKPQKVKDEALKFCDKADELMSEADEAYDEVMAALKKADGHIVIAIFKHVLNEDTTGAMSELGWASAVMDYAYVWLGIYEDRLGDARIQLNTLEAFWELS